MQHLSITTSTSFTPPNTHSAPTSTPPRGLAQEESIPLQQTLENFSAPPPSLHNSLPLSSSHFCLASRVHRFHVWAAHIDFHAGSWIMLLASSISVVQWEANKIASDSCSAEMQQKAPPLPSFTHSHSSSTSCTTSLNSKTCSCCLSHLPFNSSHLQSPQLYNSIW